MEWLSHEGVHRVHDSTGFDVDNPPLVRLLQSCAAQLIERLELVKSAVVRQCPQDGLEGIRGHLDDQLRFSDHFHRRVFERPRENHFDGSAADYDLLRFRCASDDYYCIVDRSGGFFQEILRATSENNRPGFSRSSDEDVEAL
jgi:hypothetical protein